LPAALLPPPLVGVDTLAVGEAAGVDVVVDDDGDEEGDDRFSSPSFPSRICLTSLPASPTVAPATDMVVVGRVEDAASNVTNETGEVSRGIIGVVVDGEVDGGIVGEEAIGDDTNVGMDGVAPIGPVVGINDGIVGVGSLPSLVSPLPGPPVLVRTAMDKKSSSATQIIYQMVHDRCFFMVSYIRSGRCVSHAVH
jgi:hypothetical protein